MSDEKYPADHPAWDAIDDMLKKPLTQNALRQLSLLEFADLYENMPTDDESIDALQHEMERRTWPRAGQHSEDKTFWLMVENERLKEKLAAIRQLVE